MWDMWNFILYLVLFLTISYYVTVYIIKKWINQYFELNRLVSLN